MDQYIVEFRMSGKAFPEYYTVDTRKEAYQLLDELIEEAEGWGDRWEGKISKAHHFDYKSR